MVTGRRMPHPGLPQQTGEGEFRRADAPFRPSPADWGRGVEEGAGGRMGREPELGEVGAVGTFNWPVRLESMDGEKSLEIEAMVDTGASYTMVPAGLLKELGVSPIDRIRLVLADGRTVEYDIGRAMATIDGRTEATLVIFGDDDARALLGAYTLEGLRLAVDPTSGRLIPATTAWA